MTDSVETSIQAIAEHVAAISALDDVELEHQRDAVQWLAGTHDVFRRTSTPPEPPKHLVSYFLLWNVDSQQVLLGHHRKSGLWLPSGGHVDPGESPVETVRRECREELAIEARFGSDHGEHPVMVTVTETVPRGPLQHTDVSLWYVLEASASDPIEPDDREYFAVRWWSPLEIRTGDPGRFDPHMARMLTKLGL